MSDNDTTEDNANDTIEFSESHFGEDAVNEAPEAETPAEPVEDKTETPEPEADTAEEQPEQPKSEPDPAEAAPKEEQPEGVDLKGMTRAERAEYFQNLKQEQTREVAQVIDQNYQTQNVDELASHYRTNGVEDKATGEIYYPTAAEALMLARQDVADQKTQLAEATAEIAELNANLRVDVLEAQAKYDWMNPAKPDAYDRDLHELAAELLSGYIVTDPRTGQIIDARMKPMKVAEIVDKIRNSGVGKAQIAAQKAAEAQLAAVAPPTSTAPPKSSEDADDKQASSLERALGNVK